MPGATPGLIGVDVVEPNKALVTGLGFSAYIGFYGGQGYVELTEWDDHPDAALYEVLPKLSQDKRYERGAQRLAEYVGLEHGRIEIEYEYDRGRGLPQNLTLSF
jgi:hypothetical protein